MTLTLGPCINPCQYICPTLTAIHLAQLEHQLECEMNVAGCADISIPLTKCRTRDIGVERSGTKASSFAHKNMLIPGVEILRLEAQADSFREGDILNNTDVCI